MGRLQTRQRRGRLADAGLIGARLALFAAMALTGGMSWAQAVNEVVPPPTSLDDFRIGPDGAVVRPDTRPAPVPTPQAEPVPARPVPTEPVTRAPEARSPASEAAPAKRAPAASRPAARQPVATRLGAARPVVEPPVSAPPATIEPSSPVDPTTPDVPMPQNEVAAGPAPVPAAPRPDAAAADVPATAAPAGSYGLWIWAGLLLAGLVAAALLAKRRAAARVQTQASIFGDEPDPAAHATPDPIVTVDPVATPVPTAAPAFVASDPAPRPRLRIEFKPAAARATDALATVEFTVRVANDGDAPARTVRMEARMFAMSGGHDAALAAFFESSLASPTPVASEIAPSASAELRAQVTLPGEAINPIRHADRLLFVPLVGIKLVYEWDDEQQDQVTMSYVIGRENRPRSAKMAPFRLDLGPRVYREVGQRVHQPKQLA